MTDLRLLQNFSGFRAFLVAPPAIAADTLGSTLNRIGVTMQTVDQAKWPGMCSTLNPDGNIIILDGDLNEAAGLPLSDIGRLPPAPVIGLLGVSAPSRLKALMRQGATSVLHKPVQGSAVFTALFIGINEFRRRRSFEALLNRQERRLRGRRAVIKAVVRLMREFQIDDDEAFERIRRESMASRMALEDICERLMAAPAEHDEAEPMLNRLAAGPV